MKYFLLICLIFLSTVLAAPLLTPQGNLIKGRYIVVFQENATQNDINSHMLDVVEEEIDFLYQTALKGYAGFIKPTTLERIRNSPIVEYVEQDQVVYAFGCGSQNNAIWNLDRISTPGSYNQKSRVYSHNTNGGEGVTVYVVDTGVKIDHNEFEGRASYGYDAVKESDPSDLNGHGTHVASTVGGKLYGVAKKVSIVAVKVLGKNGSGSNSGVVAGIDWAASQTKGKKTSVINMSLGGGASTATDKAVENAYKSGVTVVVAAGNENQDACNVSPARATYAFTVGSTSEPPAGQDLRSSFSNFGTCVQIFAPGSSITGAWINSKTATNTISGTSMASPHVAGAAAVILSENPGFTPKQVQERLLDDAIPNTISFVCSDQKTLAKCNASPNVFLYSGC